MGEDGFALQLKTNWRRRALIATGVFCALLLLFHRPLLLGLGRWVILHFAANENLKLDFRLEGNPFASLTVRNVHAVPTGPSDIESIDIDLVHVDYGLIALIQHGLSSALRNVEVRSARIVSNPGKAPLRPRPPDPKKKMTLPDIFPERVHVSNTTIIVRNRPHDFIIENADLDLDPRNPGALKVGRVQLVGGQTWLDVSARTEYTNRTLNLRDVVLSNDERIQTLTVDASQIGGRKLAINFDYLAGTGKIDGSIALHEAESTLETDVHLRGQNVPVGFINKYAALPENFINGQIEKLDVDLSGLVSSPQTWNGNVALQVRNFQQEATAFDRGVFQISARDGRATLETGDVVQGQNQFHLRGSSELPRNIKDFGRTPGTFEVAATVPDLRQVTNGMPQKVSGSAQLNGKVEINDGKLNGDFSVVAGDLGFADGTIEKLNAVVKVSKVVPPSSADKPWYADLRSQTTLTVSKIRMRDYAADSIDASITGADELLTVAPILVRRNQNEFTVRAEYALPRDLHDALIQPARIDISLNASQLSDYWAVPSADRISGPLQVDGQIQWKDGAANGQLTVYGADVQMRDLVFHQLSAQCTIVDSVVYVNDVRASINENDFVSAHGVFDLRAPFRYSGMVKTNLADLSVFKPLLRASGNENEVAGSFIVDWEGNGEAKTFKNSGKLKLVLDKARYGDLKSLQANIDATYSPDGFDVPIIFLRSDKMDFQAVAQAKGDLLEVNKIQLDQGTAKYAEGYISVPLVWKNLGTGSPIFPGSGKVLATFQSENLDIKKLFEDVGAKPPASGQLNVKFNAQGTLSNLDANLDVQLRDVRTDKIPKLEPASFDLNAQAKNGQLTMTGKLQQAKIQPIEIKANLPIQVTRILNERRFPDDTPVTGSVRLPRSSVNFVRQFVPAIEELDGDAGIDVEIKGTMAQPVLSGSADMTVNVGRFTNATLPALQNFKARLVFNRDTLNFERFSGELAGGPFTLSGRVTFPRL
ncbi:MAG: hypothetical protein JWO45_885, partial [Spartobacteria bacterium]|nr:hypothetical protein [Spartobacteria bacterium]